MFKVLKSSYIFEPTNRFIYEHIRINLRLVFSRFFYIRGNLGNVIEKPTRKTCFSREKRRLSPRI